MADGDNNLVRFSELKRYDEKIKSYINNKTTNSISEERIDGLEENITSLLAYVQSLTTQTLLTSSDDINSIVTPGDYRWEDSVPLHCPDPTAMYTSMKVLKGGSVNSFIQQIYCGQIFYMRYGSQSGWGDWYSYSGIILPTT